ncbi:MAG: hypothetical protein JWM46_450 [Candidatus Kaiserbacteria bacterium]|nr:hypothetical protein [Candidatus Kaiserbacteria bacterium]
MTDENTPVTPVESEVTETPEEVPAETPATEEAPAA